VVCLPSKVVDKGTPAEAAAGEAGLAAAPLEQTAN